MPLTTFITGSSRGIGKMIAQTFCCLGHNVVINGTNADRLDQTFQELSAITPNIVSILGDMSDHDTVKTTFDQIERRFGPVDVLINNAAISHIGLFTDMTPNQWNDLIKINVNAMLNCVHFALPKMITRKKGIIVNISSIWGERGASCEAVYSLTKGAVNGFTKALAKEVAPSNVRVNAIACGVIDTEMNAFLTPDEKNALIDLIPLSRFGTPNEIADLAAYLVSDKSTYITGQVINADGGI